MKLEASQEALLRGDSGPALRTAMEMLCAVGNAVGAPDLLPVSSSHIVIDSFALGEPGAKLLEEFAASGAGFKVRTTINSIAVDRRVVRDEGDLQLRCLRACEQMGALATCSCNPFTQGFAPMFGESIAWSESATAPYLNGVVGARTNREGGSALASALTGLTPRYGMHLREQRLGGKLFRIAAPMRDIADYNALGAIVAGTAGDGIPVLEFQDRPSTAMLFAFGASLAILSHLPMFHVLGVTPEALTPDAVFPDGQPTPSLVTRTDLDRKFQELRTTPLHRVDVVSLGCPHADIDEIALIAALLGDRKIKPDVEFEITTNCTIHGLADRMGLLSKLEVAGIKVGSDRMCFGCDLSEVRFPAGTTVATNSVKLATSAPGTRGVDVVFGDTRSCVEAAISGVWTIL